MLYVQKDFQPVGGKVVAYFYDVGCDIRTFGLDNTRLPTLQAFFQLWKAGLETDYRELIQSHPTAELWVFGHSLGGSIASLAAAWISSLSLIPPEKLRFVSFGQPRTGNLAFAQTFDELVRLGDCAIGYSYDYCQGPIQVPGGAQGRQCH